MGRIENDKKQCFQAFLDSSCCFDDLNYIAVFARDSTKNTNPETFDRDPKLESS